MFKMYSAYSFVDILCTEKFNDIFKVDQAKGHSNIGQRFILVVHGATCVREHVCVGGWSLTHLYFPITFS